MDPGDENDGPRETGRECVICGKQIRWSRGTRVPLHPPVENTRSSFEATVLSPSFKFCYEDLLTCGTVACFDEAIRFARVHHEGQYGRDRRIHERRMLEFRRSLERSDSTP